MKTSSPPSERPTAFDLFNEKELRHRWETVKSKYPAVAAAYLETLSSLIDMERVARLHRDDDLLGRLGIAEAPVVNRPPIDCGHAREGEVDKYLDCLEKRIAQASP